MGNKSNDANHFLSSFFVVKVNKMINTPAPMKILSNLSHNSSPKSGYLTEVFIRLNKLLFAYGNMVKYKVQRKE